MEMFFHKALSIIKIPVIIKLSLNKVLRIPPRVKCHGCGIRKIERSSVIPYHVFPNLVPRVFSLFNMAAVGEDPGTQQKSRDRFVHGEWKFIQNGGQDKE